MINLVHSSEAGMTPTEALNLLRLRVANSLHNALHELIKSKQLKRHRLQGLALYTSIDSDTARKQMTTRHEKIKSRSLVANIVSNEATIAVLVETLRSGKVLTRPSTVAARLTAQAMSITVDQVEQIFSQYGLKAEKKLRSNLEDSRDVEGKGTYPVRVFYTKSFRSDRRSRNRKGRSRPLRDLSGSHACSKDIPARGTNYCAWNIRCI